MNLVIKRMRKALSDTWTQRRVILAILIIIDASILISLLPVIRLVAMELANSQYGKDLFLRFDPQWMMEFYYHHKDALRAWLPLGFSVLAINLMFWWFVSGGFLGLLRHRQEKFKNLISQGTNYFLPMIRIAILGALLYVVLFLFSGLLGKLISHYAETSLTARPVVILRGIRMIMFVLILLFFRMWLDTTRSLVVFKNMRQTRKAFIQALGSIFHSEKNRIVSYYGIAVLGGLILFIYLFISYHLPVNTMWMVIILVFIQQIYLFIRLFLRLSALALTTDFISPLHMPEPITEPSPPLPGLESFKKNETVTAPGDPEVLHDIP